MSKSNKVPVSQAEQKKARLAEQLRANLQKRKAQSRARREGEADQREGMSQRSPSPQDE